MMHGVRGCNGKEVHVREGIKGKGGSGNALEGRKGVGRGKGMGRE